jgi:uncharacterized protein (DUF1778 family)
MILNLNFPASVESQLRERAAATGKDVTSLVLEAVAEKLSDMEAEARLPNPEALSAKEWISRLERLAARGKHLTSLVDDDREHLYEDRG